MKGNIRLIQRTPSAYSYQLTIKQIFQSAVTAAQNTEIVYGDNIRYNYQEFFQRVHKLARALSGIGIGPGDTVAVLDWDSHRYLECFFAIPMIGAILHTVNIRLSPEQILYTMNHAEDVAVLVNREFIPLIAGIKSKLETVRHYIVLEDEVSNITTPFDVSGEYEDLIKQATDSFDFPDFDENAQATTFYTTGTTGDPKGVYFSHRQIVMHTLAVCVAVSAYTAPGRFQSGDVYMPITPMFHVHAWGFPYVATMLGAKQVYPGKYVPGRILELIAKEHVTFSHCVPTVLQMIFSDPKCEETDLNGWKVNTGGMALPRGLAKTAMEKGVEIFHGYGMSETCPILTLATLKPRMMDWETERQLDFRTKTGFPLPLTDLKIVGENGEFAPIDGKSNGEITVRTPWCTNGYFKNPEKSEELWKGGRLHTGDIAVMDTEGYIQITDRLKDAIKSGGEWVSSLTLESLLSRHEAVAESAVIGIPNEKWGERPIAWIVLKSEYVDKIDPNEFTEFFKSLAEKGMVAKWAIPDQFILVDQIPKTSVGKIDKKLIRKTIS